jgi:hypothetical protein
MDYQTQKKRQLLAQRSAIGLGWFSIGLGLTELLCARGLCRWMGMRGKEDLIRFYGVREMAAGIGLLAAKEKAPWVWGRVGGDMLDIATLAAAFEGNPRKGALMTALAAVAGATAADVITAQQLTNVKPIPAGVMRDYSNRSGFPMGIENVRGVAAQDFQTPREYRQQPDMRPGALH